ncbi:MAG: hypothetical protein M1812_001138 [Candelaria pacifica]|nr:MAG: hypothetical protein M1812_001138 [Candelaria pacifica]
MEALRGDGFNHPLQRRLTAMYTDTKRSYDTVTEPVKVQETPELSSLVRRYRIQQNRLVTWGLDWSDTSASHPGDIDESLERAGLSEVVASVLSSIKEILYEADQISRTEKSDIAGSYGTEKVGEKGLSGTRWAASDKSQFEDLLRDLTTSIDTLYDLSRSRRALRQAPQGLRHSKKQQVYFPEVASQMWSLQADDYTSGALQKKPTVTTSKTAPSGHGLSLRIEPSSLILPEAEVWSSSDPPPYEAVATPSNRRTLAHIRRPYTSTNPWKIEGNRIPTVPVLIEYAAFDPVYASTGVPISLVHLENLAESLHCTDEGSTEHPGFGMLNLIGYFEDPKHPRYGLVYELPVPVRQSLSDSDGLQTAMPLSLLTLFQNPSPNLEDRLHLGYKLALAFFQLHAKGLVHRDVNSNNVMFFPTPGPSSRQGVSSDIRNPYLSSFDLFSEYDIEACPDSSSPRIYRHPLDARGNRNPTSKDYSPAFDIYALGLMLLEIGLWMPLSSFWKMKYNSETFKNRIQELYAPKLGPKCGSIYMRTAQICLSAADRGPLGSEATPTLQSRFYTEVVKRLERCCSLDEGEPLSFSTLPEAAIPQAHLPPGVEAKAAILPQAHSTVHKSSRSIRRREEDDILQNAGPTRIDQVPDDLSAETLSDVLRGCGSFSYPWFDRTQHCAWVTFHSADAYKAAVRENPHIVGGHEIVVSDHVFRQLEQLKVSSSVQADKTHPVDPVMPPNFPDTLTDQVSPTQPKQVHELSQQPPSNIFAAPPKKRLRVHPVKLPPNQLADWHQNLLPRLERILERTLKDSHETISMDLIGIGEMQQTARPTIFVTCSSVGKVKGVLSRRFRYNKDVFDLKVRSGKIRRSKMTRKKRRLPHRSMMAGDLDEQPAMNPFHQERPLCGASIGAFKDEQHLPPVSYGGVVLVDGEPYGMTVHHLLDTPSEDGDSEYGGDDSPVRASGRWPPPRRLSLGDPHREPLAIHQMPEAMYPFEISDDEEEEGGYDSSFSREDEDTFQLSSPENSDSDNESELSDSGDIAGVEQGDGEAYIITQPAIDDVDDEFFPNEDDRDEDHLDSHSLGHVHASSGVRRWNRQGVTHEIDWALLKIKEDRMQPHNLIQGGKRFCSNGNNIKGMCPRLVPPICRRHVFKPEEDLYPSEIVNVEDLSLLKVHCFGRTSGLQGGTISQAMSSVRIWGRRSFARSWSVVGNFGVGGDSGAWVIDNEAGRVCGHVLAWCEKNSIAYICPMQVLLEDIKRTLEAERVGLPGAVGVVDVEGVAAGEGDLISGEMERLEIGGGGDGDQDVVGKGKKREELPDIGNLKIRDSRVANDVKHTGFERGMGSSMVDGISGF